MKYRELGRTGLRVSEIGLGGEWLERHSTPEVKKIIEHCTECGINILDCWMPNPKVRSDIGAAIEDKRSEWVIQGHIGSTWQNGEYVRSREIAPVKESFDALLKCLRTDHVDLGMIHFVDYVDDWNSLMNSEFIDYVHDLKKSGAINNVGVSSHSAKVAKVIAESGEIDMMMFSINPAFDMVPSDKGIYDIFKKEGGMHNELFVGTDNERAELYRLCENKGIGITVMKAFAGGRLLDAKASPFGVAMSPVQCISYALTRPAVSSVLIGFDSSNQVDQAVAYESANDAEKDYSFIANTPLKAYAGQCIYCGHCAPCPADIDVALVNKYYDLALMQDEIPVTIRSHYGFLKSNASDCIECCQCEKRCPFGVHVTERMAEIRKLFG